MSKYVALNTNEFSEGLFSIVPIRYEDRGAILQWRNQQLDILRQAKEISVVEQDAYFKTTIAQLFEQKQPDQFLFSFLREGKCIGYGGLVHINWLDKNAELSFILDTALEEIHQMNFGQMFLKFIENCAFNDIHLHKIYTYAFDLRSKLYEFLEQLGFQKEAVLKDHKVHNNTFIDVVIHSKLRN